MTNQTIQQGSKNITITATPMSSRSLRFWGVFIALCLLSFISALDVAIITTALPTIIKEIGGEKQYVWIANSFVLASSVPQPLFGQLSNIFGRRVPMIVSTGLFALGSGIAGKHLCSTDIETVPVSLTHA
jgi:MFS family permease